VLIALAQMMVGIDARQPGLVISSCSCRHAVERMLNEAEAVYGIRHVAGEAISETDDSLEIDWKASASRYQRGVRLISSDGGLDW
jgi:hypothetical protein